jgi:sigma-B regulation protein RsbU (phosphoserine phosphatase)
LTIARIRQVLQPVQDVPELLAKKLEFPTTNPKAVFKSLQEVVISNREVFGGAVAYEPYMYDKKQYYYSPYFYETGDSISMKMLGGSQYDYFQKEWYTTAKSLGRGIWSEPYFDEGGGNLFMCTYAVPFYKKIEGKRIFAGVVTMDISLSSLREIVDTIHVYTTGFGFLISRSGKIITHKESKWINRDILDLAKESRDTNVTNAYRKMMKGESDFVRLKFFFEKNPEWMSYAPVDGTEWAFGLVFPMKEIFSSFIDFFLRLLIIFAVSVICLLILIILITRKFTRPITRLVEATHRIGQGDLNAPLPVYKAKDEITQLANSFSLMQVELQNYISDLKETTTAKEKIESELKIAHDIQIGLLPGSFPERDDCELYAILEPARAVGGDLYDFLFDDGEHLYLAIGDVSGKGVPAALFMAVARTLFRSRIRSKETLSRIVEEINRELCKDNPNQMFVTFIACDINLMTGEAEICNAGHCQPLLIRNNGDIEKVKIPGGIPLGIFDDAEYTKQKIFFSAGDLLLLYTDGITEATNTGNELYGDERLIRSSRKSSQESARTLVEKLVSDVKTFTSDAEQADDITLLLMKFKGIGKSRNKTEERFGITSDTVKLQIRNTVTEIQKLTSYTEKLASDWLLPGKTAHNVNLILEEVISNIIFYGYDDQTEHFIDLEFQKKDQDILITVKDDGIAFNMLEKELPADLKKSSDEREIGGLGIHFIKTLADSIEYRREGNFNILHIVKKINSN